MLIKLAFQKQIHLYKGNLNYSQLKKFCKNTFIKLPQSFHFVYLDQDNDELMMNSNLDSINFKSLFLNQNNRSIKLYIRANVEKDEQQSFNEIQLDQCEQNKLEQLQKQGYDSVANNSFEFQPLQSGSSDASSSCQSFDFQQIQKLEKQQELKSDQRQNQFINLAAYSLTVNQDQFYYQKLCQLQICQQKISQIDQKQKEEIINKNKFNMIKQLVQEEELLILQKQVKQYLKNLSQRVIQKQIAQFRQETNETGETEEIKIEQSSQIDSINQQNLKQKSLNEADAIKIERINFQKIQNRVIHKQQTICQNIQSLQQKNQVKSKCELQLMIDQRINAILPKIMKEVNKLVQQKVHKFICQIKL